MGSAQFVGLGIPKFAMEYIFRQIRIRNTGTYFKEITTKCRITMTFVVYYKTELNTSDMSDFVHPSSHVQVFFLFKSFAQMLASSTAQPWTTYPTLPVKARAQFYDFFTTQNNPPFSTKRGKLY